MSRCDVRIEFDRTDRQYQLGDTVNGEVIVTVDKTVACNALGFELGWQTHGKGNIDGATLQRKNLFTGQLEPGEHRYAFSYPVQKPPLSYRGNIVNVDWYVKARVDIPWARDPKCSEEFIVSRGQHQPQTHHALLNEFGEASNTAHILDDIGFKPIVIMFCFFLGIGLGIPALGFWMGGDMAFLIFGAFFALAVCVMFYKLTQSKLAELKLGKVSMVVSPEEFRPPHNVHVRFGFTPKSDVNIKAVHLSLRAVEHASSGSGTNTSSHSHVAFEQDITTQTQGAIKAGENILEEFDLAVPANAAASFELPDNELVWYVRLHIDIARCPDWVRQRELWVEL